MMALLLFPITLGLKECKSVVEKKDIPCMMISSWEYPNDCGTYTVGLYDSTPTLLDTFSMDNYSTTGRCNITFNYTAKGSYLLNMSSGDSASIIVESVDNMASLSIIIFVLLITAGVFFLPRLLKNFSNNEILNTTLKGLCIILGLFLLSLSTAMLSTIADNAGIEVTREIFRFLWLINWAIYVAMIIVVLRFGWMALHMWNQKKQDRQMGFE